MTDDVTIEQLEREGLLLFERAEQLFGAAVQKWYRSVVVKTNRFDRGAHLVQEMRLRGLSRPFGPDYISAVECKRSKKRGYGYSHFIWPREIQDKSPSTHTREWLATIKAFEASNVQAQSEFYAKELAALKELVTRLEREDFLLKLDGPDHTSWAAARGSYELADLEKAMLSMKAWSLQKLTEWYTGGEE